MDYQLLLVYLILAFVAVLIIRYVYRQARGKNHSCNCGCNNCNCSHDSCNCGCDY